MKNNFFVGMEVFVLISISVSICIGCYLGCAIGIGYFFDDVLLATIITIMMVVLPIIALVCSIFLCVPKIQIDESGITKMLLGRKQKCYSWDEIDHVKFIGNLIAATVSFYKKREIKSFMRHFSSYERIYFYLDEKRWEVIEYYAPQSVKALIEKAKQDLNAVK